MKRSHQAVRFSSSVIIALFSIMQASRAQQVAVVSGADIIGNIAIQELSNAPIMRKYLGENQNEEAQAQWGPLVTARQARLEASTGLTEEDILSATFSLDIDTLNMKAPTPREQVSGLSALLAIKLAKALEIDQLKQALKLEYGSPKLAGVSDVSVAGRSGLKINASTEDDPDVYLTITPNQKVVLIAFNTTSLTDGLQRITDRKAYKAKDAISHIQNLLPTGAQVHIAGVVPPSIRKMINDQVLTMTQQAAQNPKMAITLGFVKLFQGIKNIGFALQLDDGAQLSLLGELGSPQAAQQASLLLNNMVIPMMHAAILQHAAPSETSPDIGGMMTAKAQADALHINLRLTDAHIDQILETAAKAQGAHKAQ